MLGFGSKDSMELRSGPRRRSPRLLALGGAPDLISALPDDLILLVLARLPCVGAAARTGVLSRRWRGLWARLCCIVFRNVPFLSLEPALARFSRPRPTVSLLGICPPEPCGRIPKEPLVDSASLSSLLRAAARLDPEKLVLVFPPGILDCSSVVDLPCFHRATCIVMKLDLYEKRPTIRRVPAGVEFPALETLFLSSWTTGINTLLSHCPRLRRLALTNVCFHEGDLRINSPLLQELVVAGAGVIYHVNIVAPVLKHLDILIHLDLETSISVLAPMMENVYWHCFISNSTEFGFWRVGEVTLKSVERQGVLKIHADVGLPTFFEEGEKFMHEIEKHMIAEFSILELHLTTEGHVFGAFVSHLLGMNRIRCAMQRLKVDLQRPMVKGKVCPPNCPCDSPDWKSQTFSLTYLEEVEFDGFEGEDHELDLLKLILRCAPMLKRMIMKLSKEAWTGYSRCTKIYDIFKAYTSVECYIYLSTGLMHGSRNCPLT